MPFIETPRGEIQLPKTTPIAFLLFCKIPPGQIPTSDTIRQLIATWIPNNVNEPLRDLVGSFFQRPIIDIRVTPTNAMPELKAHLKRKLSDEQNRLVDEANIQITIRSEDMMIFPRVAFWCCVAGALACRDKFGGLILDGDTSRALPRCDHFSDLHEQGMLHLRYFVTIPYSWGDDRKMWMTTQGIERFGLPELQIEDIPMIDVDALTFVLCGICQVLVDMAMRLISENNPPIDIVTLPLEIMVTQTYLQLARGLDLQTPSAGSGSEMRVRLELRASKRVPEQRFLTVLPPAGYTGDYGAWLHQLVNTFFAAEDSVPSGAADEDAIETAHLKALQELPDVKKRFQEGRLEDRGLLVKHAFPILNNSGTEYMWVWIRTWVGDQLEGELINTPNRRTDLRAGQKIVLRDHDIYDWSVQGADGIIEGGYTEQVVRAQGGMALPKWPIPSDIETKTALEAEIKRQFQKEPRVIQRRKPSEPWPKRIGFGLIVGIISLIFGRYSFYWPMAGGLLLVVLGVRAALNDRRIEKQFDTMEAGHAAVAQNGKLVVAVEYAATEALRKPMNTIAPCLALITFEEHSDTQEFLFTLAAQVYQMQGTKPTNPELAKVANFMGSEHATYRRTLLPLSMTNGRNVYAVDILVEQEKLKHGYLDGHQLVCLAVPGNQGAIEVVPWRLLEQPPSTSQNKI